MSETLREAILAFDSATAIMLFTPTMVVIAVWHEIRERRRRQRTKSLAATAPPQR